MKKRLACGILVLSMLFSIIGVATTLCIAADPVDLRGKKGVVKDLKQDDPKPPKLTPKAPPPLPEQKKPSVPYEVKKSHEGVPGNNPANK